MERLKNLEGNRITGGVKILSKEEKMVHIILGTDQMND